MLLSEGTSSYVQKRANKLGGAINLLSFDL